MKKRIALIPIALISFILLLVSGLSVSEGAEPEDTFIFLPIIMDISDKLYRDDFSDPNSGWPVNDDGNVARSYQNGVYEMLIRDAGYWAGARAPIVGFVDYGVEAEMWRYQGGRTSNYGLVFDRKDWDNFYFLVVDTTSQWFGVAKVVDGVPQVAIPRTDSAAIKPGGKINKLRVDRKGNVIVVTINGTGVATEKDSGFDGDLGVGLFMEVDDDVPARVHYDNFVVWQFGTGKPQRTKMSLAESHFSGEDDFAAVFDGDR